MNATETVRAAINNTKAVVSGYWAKCLQQRSLQAGGTGSVYNLSPEGIEQALQGASWEPYEHPAVMPGCRAFRAPLAGFLGVVKVSEQPVGTVFTLTDPKDTGTCELAVQAAMGPEVDFTVIILGMEQGSEVVFTFHPGEPIRPSQVQAPSNDGRKIGREEAMLMGFIYAKVVVSAG